MILNTSIHQNYLKAKHKLRDIVNAFDTTGTDYGNQNRNSLKLFNFEGITINVKSFKVPNLINQIAYRFFRKSKAQRSFEYANKLLTLNIGTPQPIAFYEFQSLLLFKKSYYISEQLDCDLTFRELTSDLNYPNHELILRAFTRFTFDLHENGIHFLDHSPGNTLIKEDTNGKYHFYLVDLNRMEFLEMDYTTRIKNFSRLTKEKALIKIMANEYAQLIHQTEEKVYKDMMYEITEFQNQFHKKRALKQKLKFWKR